MEHPALSLPFFFIIGRPRSGTTLIRTLLDAHPAVIVPPEYPIIPDIFHRFGQYPEWTPHRKNSLLEAFKKPQTFDFWKYEYLQIDEAALHDALDSCEPGTPTREILKLFYYHSRSVFTQKTQIRLLGDKNPVYALYTPLLIKWFPEAKFLFITRDYRDNLVSMRKFDWEAPHPVLQAWRWKYIARMMVRLKNRFPERIFMFRYEDLANRPEKILGQICKFLGIDYTPVMLDFYRKSSEKLHIFDHAALMKYHESLTRPVHTDNIGLWKQKLKPEEIALMDTTVGEWAKRCGYERKYVNTSLYVKARTLPMRFYGWLLYKLMLGGEYIPFPIKSLFSRVLPYLVKIYRIFNKK